MIFAIVGHSSSGKSTIERKVSEKYSIDRIISYTTRPMRDGEKNYIDYKFISEDEFKKKEKHGFFTETASYREWNYGLSLYNLDYTNKHYLAVVTPKGYRELVEKAGRENVTSFFIRVPERERLIRMASRGDDIDEVMRRIHADRIDFDGFEDEADFIIDNINIDDSINMAYTIIKCLNK